MANVYCQCGTGVKDVDLDYLRAIAEASDGGRRCGLAFGDWNLTPEELEASGVLDWLGLEIVRPTNSTISCTAGRQGSLIDYVIVTQGYRSIIQICEITARDTMRHAHGRPDHIGRGPGQHTGQDPPQTRVP